MKESVFLLIILVAFSSCMPEQRGQVKPDARYGWDFIICPRGTLIGNYETEKPGLYLSEELFKQMRAEDEAEKVKLRKQIEKLKKGKLLWVTAKNKKGGE